MAPFLLAHWPDIFQSFGTVLLSYSLIPSVRSKVNKPEFQTSVLAVLGLLFIVCVLFHVGLPFALLITASEIILWGVLAWQRRPGRPLTADEYDRLVPPVLRIEDSEMAAHIDEVIGRVKAHRAAVSYLRKRVHEELDQVPPRRETQQTVFEPPAHPYSPSDNWLDRWPGSG